MDDETRNIKLTIYGYKFIDSSIVKNENFKKCIEMLPKLSHYKTSTIAKKMIPIISRNILEKHFPKLNKNILILPEAQFNSMYKEYLPIDKESLKEFINLLNKTATYSSIYNLPIIYLKGTSIDGNINKPMIYTQDIDLLNNYKLYFSHIELGDDADYLSPLTLVHESTHALLERNKGSVSNYLNAEVLSIFMEKVAALDISDKLLKVSETNRLYDIKETVNNLKSLNSFPIEETEKYQYLYSGFLAEQLFNIYLEGNLFIRKQLLREINKILEGNLVLEDFLESKEVSYNNDEICHTLQKNLEKQTIRNNSSL